GIDAEIRRLDIAIAEHDANSGRNTLTQSLSAAMQAAQRAVAEFERRLETVAALQALNVMQGFGFDALIPATSGLTRAARDAAIDRPSAALTEAEAAVLASDKALLESVDEARKTLIRKAGDDKAQYQRLTERLKQHDSG